MACSGSSFPGRGRPPRAPCVHEHYVQLKQSYMGMWLASHALLLRFMDSTVWTEEGALGRKWYWWATALGYNYPERSTAMIQVRAGWGLGRWR